MLIASHKVHANAKPYLAEPLDIFRFALVQAQLFLPRHDLVKLNSLNSVSFQLYISILTTMDA